MPMAEQTTLTRLTKGEKLPELNGTNARIAEIMQNEPRPRSGGGRDA